MRAFRIPGVIDVLSVSEPALIRALADNPDLDRKPSGGPLLVRLIRGSLAQALKTPEGPLPSALPRGSAERHQLRDALSRKLEDQHLDTRLAGPIDACGAYVRSGEGDPGLLAQTLFGRIFVDDFSATDDTWDAARTINRALSPSPAGLWLRLTGRVREAQATLSKAMKQDRNGVHAIGVAVHNFSATLEKLRGLDGRMTATQAAAKALTVPRRVPRQGMSVAETVAARVRPGTLVLLNTEDAHRRSLDPEVGFLRSSWSGCPAHALVPRLVTSVWLAAHGDADG